MINKDNNHTTFVPVACPPFENMLWFGRCLFVVPACQQNHGCEELKNPVLLDKTHSSRSFQFAVLPMGGLSFDEDATKLMINMAIKHNITTESQWEPAIKEMAKHPCFRKYMPVNAVSVRLRLSRILKLAAAKRSRHTPPDGEVEKLLYQLIDQQRAHSTGKAPVHWRKRPRPPSENNSDESDDDNGSGMHDMPSPSGSRQPPAVDDDADWAEYVCRKKLFMHETAIDFHLQELQNEQMDIDYKHQIVVLEGLEETTKQKALGLENSRLLDSIEQARRRVDRLTQGLQREAAGEDEEEQDSSESLSSDSEDSG